MIETDHPELSLRKQCELLSLSRSGWYYQAVDIDEEWTLELMHLIDAIYTESPFFGYRRITATLRRMGHVVNGKRIQGLMRKMGLEAIYPKKNTSKPNKEHKKYPYLLDHYQVNRPGQVWASDITYIRMRRGFLYLTAIMDWYSRYVLSWRLSNTLDAGFCMDALKESIERFGKPDIFNSDQGCQYTSDSFTGILQDAEIKISMNGKGRCHDNIFVERLWRNVKYEEVFLKDYRDGSEAEGSLGRYFQFYNERRPHQSLEYKTPEEVYFNKRASKSWDCLGRDNTINPQKYRTQVV